MQALVSVYIQILNFYRAAHQMLTREGTKLAVKMVLETDRLPNIIQEFLRHADVLRKLIEKATWEVVEDIKLMLYDHDSKYLTFQTWYMYSQFLIRRMARWRQDTLTGTNS